MSLCTTPSRIQTLTTNTYSMLLTGQAVTQDPAPFTAFKH
jgi:hypothetical protein